MCDAICPDYKKDACDGGRCHCRSPCEHVPCFTSLDPGPGKNPCPISDPNMPLMGPDLKPGDAPDCKLCPNGFTRYYWPFGGSATLCNDPCKNSRCVESRENKAVEKKPAEKKATDREVAPAITKTGPASSSVPPRKDLQKPPAKVATGSSPPQATLHKRGTMDMGAVFAQDVVRYKDMSEQ